MIFNAYDVPVAYSMVALARQSKGNLNSPIQEFMCHWIAFNNIYTTIADQEGWRVQPKKSKDGSLKFRTKGNVQIVDVEYIKEQEQIDSAFRKFSDDLKHRLIIHPSTKFFVYRRPRWHGREIEEDELGQQLNGVLNVGHTTDSRHPVWSPIDRAAYEKYVSTDQQDDRARTDLARQILDVLYTIRNNTFHGGKRADDAFDMEVLEQATPLLKIIVADFMR